MRRQFILRVLAVALPALCGARPEVSLAQSKPIVAETYYNTFSRAHKPLARIRPGETVVTKTIDASGHDDTGTVRGVRPNPLTGPFYVEGAEPGDALVVRFTRVRMNRNWGFSSYRLGLYSLTPESIEGIYPNRYKPGEIIKDRENVVPWDLDLTRQMVRLREPSSAVHKLEFPAKPMLGCVGVAPAGDFAPTSSPSGSYGGNLDYNEIGEGSTVILPVYSCRRAVVHRRRRTRCREMASRRARASKRRWPSSSWSSCARKRALPGRASRPASTSSASAASPSLRARPIAGCRWRQATW